MSPKKKHKNPLKRAVGRPHLKGFHVHHVERIVRFISVGEGANCRAKGRCLTANAPFQVTKKNKRKAKKRIIFQPFPTIQFFRGNKIFQLFGGNSRFFSAHPWGGHPKVKAFPRGLHFRELGPTVQPGRKRLSKESF